MVRWVILLVVTIALFSSGTSWAGGHRVKSSKSKSSSKSRGHGHHHKSLADRGGSQHVKDAEGPRDHHGMLKHPSVAKDQFLREQGYAHGRPGYVVRYIVPLSQGGVDSPSNLKWETVEEARGKGH